MEQENRNQIQKISQTMLERKELSPLSTELITTLVTNDLIAFKIKSKDIAVSGQPKFETIFEQGTPLAILDKNVGRGNVVKMIILLIEDLNFTLNVQRPMNERQISDFAIEFYTEQLKYIRFEEIIAFFEGVKRGVYGQVYERMDSAILSDMWLKYDENKTGFCQMDAQRNQFKDPSVISETRQKLDGLYGVSESINGLKNSLGKIRKNEK